MRLKVAFIIRSTFDSVRGGDSIQAWNCARELQNQGVSVDIRKASEKFDYAQYDLLHLFNITRPADHLGHISSQRIPFVVTTNYIDYSTFDVMGRRGLSKYFFRLMGKHRSEWAKAMYRFLNHQECLVSPAYLKGHKQAMTKILRNAKVILTNSNHEYLRILNDFTIEKIHRIIPNGVNPAIFRFQNRYNRKDDQVLCVGQIYGLKNQHHLIEATRKIGARLVIIGTPPPNHHSYYKFCRKIAHPRVEFHDFMTQEKLVRFYAESKVHALPSWFETTGLSSLEAGAMGCNLVVGNLGDTHDYFSNYASFCQAQDQNSLQDALIAELEKQNSLEFRTEIMKSYTWEAAAKKIHSAYLEALEYAG